MIKNKTLYCFLLISIFFTSVMGIEAQQRDFYFNPLKESIIIQQVVDYLNYDYEYEIISEKAVKIRLMGPIQPSGVTERFISTIDELTIFDNFIINKEILTIPWTGMNDDGFTPLPDGRYLFRIYETNKMTRLVDKIYTYNATIDKTKVIFDIQLKSDILSRRFKDTLVCNVKPSSEEAYIWRVKIQSNDTIVKEQNYRYGGHDIDIPFPRFSWDDYAANGPEQQFSITVEATDRAGNTSIQTANFRLTNGERIEREGETNTTTQSTTITVVPPIPEDKTENYLSLRPEDYIIYNVKRGDYLAKIAREYYGSAPLWGIIYEINRNRLPQHNDPNLILPRTQLILPTKKFMADLLKAGSQTPIR